MNRKDLEEVCQEIGIDSELLINSVNRISKHLRVNTLRINEQQFEELLRFTELSVKRVNFLKHPVYEVLKGRPGNTFLHTFGFVFSQSLSSMLPVFILKPEEKSCVLDICAAPGAKTTLCAELMKNTGAIIAVEQNKKRMEALVSNLRRMGMLNVCCWHKDATQINPKPIFDHVIVDPPCSSLGVSSGYKIFSKRAMKKLTKKQKLLLNVGWEFLKPNGTLVYSTCTLTYAENEKLIEEFVKDKGAAIEEIDTSKFPGSRKGLDGLGIRLIPWEFKSEGFFIALLRKEG